jgi:predicted secreted protein
MVSLLSFLSLFLLISFTLGCPVISSSQSWDPAVEVSSNKYKLLDENHRGLELSPGEQFIVQLHSNPSTGFSWTLDESNGRKLASTAPYLSLNQCKYQRSISPSQIVGAGGREYWLFSVNAEINEAAPATQYIYLDYARAWESGKHVKEITFTVDIKS